MRPSSEAAVDGAASASPHGVSADAEGQLMGARRVQGGWGRVLSVIAVAFTLYYMYTAFFGIVSPQAHRGPFWGFAGVMIFLLYPARRKTAASRPSPSLIDWVLSASCAIAALYFVSNYAEFITRTVSLTPLDTAIGVAAIVLSLEMTRRTVGWTLSVIASAAILFMLLGPYLPSAIAHGGYSLERFISSMYTTFNGLFGVVANVFATFVFLYIVFGAVLTHSAAAKFLVDLPYAAAGHLRGGPAKVAIASSAVMASVSGSAVANVMTTGSFSIPLMKRTGYRKEFAGAVEAAASVGGVLTPPVMGAGAFLIAQFTQTSYTHIILISIVPAAMYFLGVYLLVDFEAAKEHLAGIPRSQLPRPWAVFKSGWFHLIPVVLIFVLILLRYSPAFAGFWGIISALLIGMIPYDGLRLRPRDMVGALGDGAVKSLSIAGVVGSIGIVIGVVNLTGVGLRFSDSIVSLAGNSLILGLILVTLVSWVLGLGLGVTVSYIVVAVLAAPALTELGTSLLVAHLIIFWVAQDANLTPPVCLAAFAGAGIAGGKPMATGFEAWKLGRGLYIVPFLMAYSPLIDGPFTAAIPVVLTGCLGIYGLSAGMSGYWLLSLSWLERLPLMVGGGLLIAPGWTSNAIGAAIMSVMGLLQLRQRRSKCDKGSNGSSAAGSASTVA
jgi:TRAP transporter 4TM/12TM fusion protein